MIFLGKMLKGVSVLPLPASRSRAGDAAPSRGHRNLHLSPPGTSWLVQRTLATQAPALPWANPLLCFLPEPSLQRAAARRTLSLEENQEKYTTQGKKNNLLPLRLQLLLQPSSIAKGKSRQQVPQEAVVPPWRKAVCARCWPSSPAECAICFPVLDLAYNLLLKQLVAKLTNASTCTEPVWLLHAKGCSHQTLPRGDERLPLSLQLSWVSEIPYSNTGEAHPTSLPYQHRASPAPCSVWE